MKLAEWMALKGKSDEWMSDQLKVSKVSVSRYRTGARIPEWHVMPKIVRTTNGAVTPNDFMPDGDSKSAREGSRQEA